MQVTANDNINAMYAEATLKEYRTLFPLTAYVKLDELRRTTLWFAYKDQAAMNDNAVRNAERRAWGNGGA